MTATDHNVAALVAFAWASMAYGCARIADDKNNPRMATVLTIVMVAQLAMFVVRSLAASYIVLFGAAS